MRMTLNVLVTLIAQAKITGRGRVGNGRLFIRLLSILADCKDPSLTWERNTLSLFTDAQNKAEAYKKTDRFLYDFMPTGNGYPTSKITVSRFENSVNCKGKCRWEIYRSYLAKMGDFCAEVLDAGKIPSLVCTILHITEQDERISTLYYGGTFVSKNQLTGTAAHPVRLSAEDFLLGILYETMRQFYCEKAKDLSLRHENNPSVFLTFLGDSQSPVFWKSITELQNYLDTNYRISLREFLQNNSAYFTKKSPMQYPLEIGKNRQILPAEEVLSDLKKHVFLSGSGGIGKSTLLQHLQGKNRFLLIISSYRRIICEPIHPTISCWILVQILLKYRYLRHIPHWKAASPVKGVISFFRN